MTPVCILPTHPESPEVETIDMNLVDLSFNEPVSLIGERIQLFWCYISFQSEKSEDSQSIWSLNNENRNVSFSANVIEEK